MVLSFFGSIHGTSLRIGSSVGAFGYLIIAGSRCVLSCVSYPDAALSAEPAIVED